MIIYLSEKDPKDIIKYCMESGEKQFSDACVQHAFATLPLLTNQSDEETFMTNDLPHKH